MDCPAGKVVGGGFLSQFNVGYYGSWPYDADTWAVGWQKLGAGGATVYAYAICMTTEPSTVIATSSKSKVAKKRGK